MEELARNARREICLPFFEKYGGGKDYLTTEELYNYTKYEKDAFGYMTKEESQKLVTVKIRI